MTPDRFTSHLEAPRRVLMTADTVGGVWTYAMELTRALGEHDVEVALATMGLLNSAHWREAERIRNLEVFESDWKLEWMDDPWDHVRRAGEWLMQLEGQLQPDLIHLNGYTHGALPFRAPKVVVGHSCVLSWWRAVRGCEAPAEWGRYREAVRNGLQNADRVIAPSRAMLRELQRDYGPFRTADVVLNGRTLALPRPTRKEPLILSAGRLWDQAKGVSTLADIAADLPWTVFVAGDFIDPSGCNRSMANVQCLGKLAPDDLTGWFCRSSIYALPARYEPFGLSVLEAALAGCALVLGDIPSLREIWDERAMFVRPGDPGALREAIETLIENEPLRRDLAGRARHRAAELTPAQMAGGYLAIYSELMRTTEPQPEFVCVS